jgi:hypothetical protein
MPAGLYDVKVGGDHAYVARISYTPMGDFAGLLVVDVTDPRAPLLQGQVYFDLEGSAGLLAVSGDYAYTPGPVPSQGGEWGISVIDVSNPWEPQIVAGVMPQSSRTCGLALQGARLYTAGTDRFEVVDITDPLNLQLVGGVGVLNSPSCLAVSENHAYVPGYSGILQVIDIADPTDPVPVGQAALPTAAGDASVEGPCAYLAAGSFGLMVVDVSSPAQPWLVGGATPYGTRFVTVADDHVYANADGLQILPIQCVPGGVGEDDLYAPSLRLRVVPNPAFGQATIRCTLSPNDRVRAAIFDATGRQVRLLQDGISGPGTHEWLWDQRDGNGRIVAPGVYLARISTPGASALTRVVLLR